MNKNIELLNSISVNPTLGTLQDAIGALGNLFWWVFIAAYVFAIALTIIFNVVGYIKWLHSENKDEIPFGKEVLKSVMWLIAILLAIPLILILIGATISWISPS